MARVSWIVLVALAAIAAGTSGCFQPKYTDGSLQCSAAGECPKGLSCFDGRCYHGNPAGDLGGGGGGDGPDMTSTLPVCVFGTNAYGDACRFGP
jgi:hypothetical protein